MLGVLCTLLWGNVMYIVIIKSYPLSSLEVKANAVGWDHDVVATAYMNLSTLNVHRQDYTTAKQLICKAMAIQEVGGLSA